MREMLAEVFDADGDGEVSEDELREGLAAMQSLQREQGALLQDMHARFAALEVQHEEEIEQQSADMTEVALARLFRRLGKVQSHIPHREYLAICSDFGLDEREALALSRNLTDDGHLVHCASASGGVALLQPAAVGRRVAAAASRPGAWKPRARCPRRQRTAREDARLERLEEELQESAQQRAQLDSKGAASVSRRLTVALGAWGAQVALYWYLVYHPQALSWDVMEPVTYFTLEGTAIGWWLLYICSSREASLSDLRQGWVEKACRKQYGEPWAQPDGWLGHAESWPAFLR